MIKRIWIITLFPEYFRPFFEVGVISRTPIDVNFVQLRDYSPKDYKGVDCAPYGGGVGMVMRADVLKNALLEGVIKPGNYGEDWKEKLHIVFPNPKGEQWSNKAARSFSQTMESKDIVFICGRYEGIDQRFIDAYVDQEISIGDYVLTGGELAVMAVIDSSLRFVNGVLGNGQSSIGDSFEDGLLEHSSYTRPADFEGMKVPEILLSGHHKNIEEHRLQERIKITKERRPDLYELYNQKRKK